MLHIDSIAVGTHFSCDVELLFTVVTVKNIEGWKLSASWGATTTITTSTITAAATTTTNINDNMNVLCLS